MSVETSFSGSLLCIQERGPTLQHPFLHDSWVKVVTCSLHDHSVHNQPSCVSPTTSCWAVTCMKPHASPNSSSIISLKHVNENSLRSHILAVLFKISLYLGVSMSYTPIFRHNQTYVTVDLLVVCFAWAHTPQHAMLWSSVNSHFIYHILGQSLQQGSFFWILLIEWRSRSVWVQMCDTNADNEQ